MTLLTGITFAIVFVFASQAFAVEPIYPKTGPSQAQSKGNNTHVEQIYKPQAATKPKTKPVGTGTITHRKAGGTQQ